MAVCCLYSCLCQVRQSNSLNTSVASPDQYKSRKALPNMRKVCYQCCVLSHYASSRTVFLSHCASSVPCLLSRCARCHAVLALVQFSCHTVPRLVQCSGSSLRWFTGTRGFEQETKRSCRCGRHQQKSAFGEGKGRRREGATVPLILLQSLCLAV